MDESGEKCDDEEKSIETRSEVFQKGEWISQTEHFELSETNE